MNNNKRRSLREIVELEGGGGVITVEHPRDALAVFVRTLYRPARANLRESDDLLIARGEAGMRAFAETMHGFEMLFGDADSIATFLAVHNHASALGVLGLIDKQNATNRHVYSIIKQEGYAEEVDAADLAFVLSKVFFGLLENDEEFAWEVKLDEWRKRVTELEVGRYPDFPGRALKLAEHLHDHDVQHSVNEHLEEIRDLLTRAGKCDFGKEDQIRRADAFAQTIFGDGDEC